METKEITFHYDSLKTTIRCKVDLYPSTTSKNYVGIYPGEYETVSNQDERYEFEILDIFDQDGNEKWENESMYFETIKSFIKKGNFDFYKVDNHISDDIY